MITLAGPFEYRSSGIGTDVSTMADTLEQFGLRVRRIPRFAYPVHFQEQLLLVDETLEYVPDFSGCRHVFLLAMYESTWTPPHWVQKMNRATGIIVPSRWVRDNFVRGGVQRPVQVIPLAVDPSIYSYCERPRRPGLTSLVVGAIEHPEWDRKNYRVAVDAWKMVARPEDRLILKSTVVGCSYDPGDVRISIRGDEGGQGIPQYYQQADLLLALGVEGFGLPLVEAMATGLPCIALNYAGQADICGQGLTYDVLPVGERPFSCPVMGPAGTAKFPSAAEVADKIQHVMDHLDEARDMGRRACEWVTQHRTLRQRSCAVLQFAGETMRISWRLAG
jgi:glycosyltransferase involved in cell wall biosynthesis